VKISSDTHDSWIPIENKNLIIENLPFKKAVSNTDIKSIKLFRE
jgi:hypothetical protein